MKEKYNQEKFFNSTLSKIENNLTKLIFETNFSNEQSILLREEIKKYKRKLIRKSNSQKNYEPFYTKINQNIFPFINNRINPNALNKNSTIFTSLIKNKNIISHKQDMKHIFVKDSLKKEIKNYNNKKYLKYSNENMNKRFYHTQLHDKSMNAIIRNKDIDKGLLDMINKGLIPKCSDVTPAFNRDGNPFSITSTNFNKFRKTFNKNDISNALQNKFRYRPEYNFEVFYKTYQPKFKKLEVNKVRMKREDLIEKRHYNENNKNNLINKEDYRIGKEDINTNTETIMATSNNTETKNNFVIQSKNAFDKKITLELKNNSNQKSFYEYIKSIDLPKNIMIKFKDYKIISDENFELFKKNNINNWTKIENILGNLSILFEKLNINEAEIDSSKILELMNYYDEDIKMITNKDLLICLSDKELKGKGFNLEDEKLLYVKVKELFIIKIQRTIRRMLAIKKYKNLKRLDIHSVIIQKYVRGYIQKIKIKKEKKKFKKEIHNKYLEILDEFKKNYDSKKHKNIQKIEIHINSLTYESSINCTIDKYILKESLQLNRLIRLKDKNLKLIFILPFHLSEDILSYYYSTLTEAGIEDIKDRVEFIVPEGCEYFPEYFSLSKLLYLSPKTLNIIRIKCKNKFACIVPGIVGQMEENLSYLLDIPILMGNLEKINSFFNKSGVKSFLEINEIPFPMSAWDIKTSEEFYSSLAHLIALYPSIRIWIMKANNDINGRTTSYIDTDKVDFIVQLKKEKKENKHMTVDLFQEKLYYQLKNIIYKNIVFCYPNFFRDWDEYIEYYLNNKGIIEACPTKYLDGIMGHPCIPMLIEPNGNIKLLPSFEKINIDYFKNIINISPQSNIEEEVLNNMAQKLGTFFYLQNIIGYITIECITFHDGKKVLFWCTDVIYGLTQTLCDILFGYFLYNQASDKINKLETNDFWRNKLVDDNNQNKDEKNTLTLNENINTKNSLVTTSIIEEKIINQTFENVKIFSIPYITTEIIKKIKLKQFLRDYSYSNIIFDEKKGEGVIFNFCDGLECGIFGMCGIINNDNYERINLDYKLFKLIDDSLGVLRNSIYNTNKKVVISSINKQVFGSKDRTDIISIHLIYNKVKKILREKEIENKKEETRMKKIADEQFL